MSAASLIATVQRCFSLLEHRKHVQHVELRERNVPLMVCRCLSSLRCPRSIDKATLLEYVCAKTILQSLFITIGQTLLPCAMNSTLLNLAELESIVATLQRRANRFGR